MRSGVRALYLESTVLIKACLNGGTTREAHPSVPQTPGELAADAGAAASAGAGAVHLHPRDASGAETLEPADVLAAVAAVRAAVPATPVGVTTGLWAAGGDPARRMALVSRWVGSHRPDFASVNLSEPGADELAGLLAALGIAVEAGVWSAEDADRLAASAFAGSVLRILIEPHERMPEAAVATAASVEAALDRHGLSAPRLHTATARRRGPCCAPRHASAGTSASAWRTRRCSRTAAPPAGTANWWKPPCGWSPRLA
jgi:uncharacterized protein (DUF849 family)